MNVRPSIALELISSSASVLFANGHTTHRMIQDIRSLGSALGYKVNTHTAWSQVTIRAEPIESVAATGGALQSRVEIVEVMPAGVDMNKVSRTLKLIDQVREGVLAPETAVQELKTIAAMTSVSNSRFIIMAGLGAAALAIIFGATDALTLLLTLLVACLGAGLRRLLAKHARNVFSQPLAAAFVAGGMGAIIQKYQLCSSVQYIEICPCMILVPGAHIISGSIDVARGRIELGVARLGYSGLTILMICLGLIAGLTIGGESLAPMVSVNKVPLGVDVIAAGVAVAAFGTFFALPWTAIWIPVLIGMSAHAIRWGVMDAGNGVVMGAAIACCFTGLVATPLAHKFKLPFAALAFASVVSMMPGVFLFKISSALYTIYEQGEKSGALLLASVAANLMTSTLICLAIAFGLIVPKLTIDRYFYKEL